MNVKRVRLRICSFACRYLRLYCINTNAKEKSEGNKIGCDFANLYTYLTKRVSITDTKVTITPWSYETHFLKSMLFNFNQHITILCNHTIYYNSLFHMWHIGLHKIKFNLNLVWRTLFAYANAASCTSKSAHVNILYIILTCTKYFDLSFLHVNNLLLDKLIFDCRVNNREHPNKMTIISEQ